MRHYERKEVERPRLNLTRGIDGRLRQAGENSGAAIVPQQVPVTPIAVEATVKSEGQVIEKTKPRGSKLRLRLPRMSLPMFRLKRLNKKHAYVAASTLLVVLLATAGYSLLGRHGKQPTQPPQKVLDLKDTTGPEFNALLPKGKSIQDLGGWARVSPADKDPVFAYVDVLDGVQLNISQQQLPVALRANTADQVEKLAAAYAANEKIAIDTGTAYLGTSIHGPQSLIFTRNGLLILIKSSGKLTDRQWAGYVSSLK